MRFDTDRYKVYTWKHWVILHWILNPGLAINELLLGQRVAKVSLVDQASDRPLMERSFVPCPHCETLHDSRIWSSESSTAFKNWFGLYCPSCGDVIPCLMNATSFIVLVVSYPIWGWFRKSLRAKWLARQPERYNSIDVEQIPNRFDKKHWVRTGLGWGLFMFVFMTLISPLINGDEIGLKSLFMGLIMWSIGGLIFGYSMKLFMNSKVSKLD